MGIDEYAAEAVATSIDHLKLVSGLHAEHPDAMLRIALRQCQRFLYVRCIKLDHIVMSSSVSALSVVMRGFSSSLNINQNRIATARA